MKAIMLLILLTGCEAAKSQPQSGDVVEETPKCSSLPTADFRNSCNWFCEAVKDEAERNDCLHWRKEKFKERCNEIKHPIARSNCVAETK